MTDPDRIYTKGETFLLPVTIDQTAPPDRDGEVRVTIDPTPDDEYVYVPASALLPPDRTWTAPKGFRIIPTDDWTKGQEWWPLTYPTTYTPWTHPPVRADRTHIMVRDTPATERVPWHTAVGRTLPDGRTVVKAGITSGMYVHGAVSPDDGDSTAPRWYPADADGTVEVLTITREVSP